MKLRCVVLFDNLDRECKTSLLTALRTILVCVSYYFSFVTIIILLQEKAASTPNSSTD